MLKRAKVNLQKPYISEPLDSDTFKKALSSDVGVVHHLYVIKNGLHPVQRFATIEDPNYHLIAHVRTEYGFIGKAKSQAWSVTSFSSLVKRKPKYTLSCILHDLKTNQYEYYNKIESLNPDVIYNAIEETYQDLQIFLNSFD